MNESNEPSDEAKWAVIRTRRDILEAIAAAEQRLIARIDRLEILLTEIAEAFTNE